MEVQVRVVDPRGGSEGYRQSHIPCLTPDRQAGTRLTNPEGTEGWVAL